MLILLCKCSMFSLKPQNTNTEIQIVGFQDPLVQNYTLVECYKKIPLKHKKNLMNIGYPCWGLRTQNLAFSITLLSAF